MLAGTDYPYDMGMYDPRGFVEGAGSLKAADKAKILGLNAARLLKIKAPARPRKRGGRAAADRSILGAVEQVHAVTRGKAMARVLGLGHVGIYVRDLARMVAFYRDVLGHARSPSRTGASASCS